jgi:hypothetical protein
LRIRADESGLQEANQYSPEGLAKHQDGTRGVRESIKRSMLSENLSYEADTFFDEL